jgi:hypothetical protein
MTEPRGQERCALGGIEGILDTPPTYPPAEKCRGKTIISSVKSSAQISSYLSREFFLTFNMPCFHGLVAHVPDDCTDGGDEQAAEADCEG